MKRNYVRFTDLYCVPPPSPRHKSNQGWSGVLVLQSRVFSGLEVRTMNSKSMLGRCTRSIQWKQDIEYLIITNVCSSSYLLLGKNSQGCPMSPQYATAGGQRTIRAIGTVRISGIWLIKLRIVFFDTRINTYGLSGSAILLHCYPIMYGRGAVLTKSLLHRFW